ncbi:hypothetical protein EVAR_97972_1 [Eumeta japonica]|uniref:Uncharacterized protein n=1 Tax=Eumeta variegata TaxID=151549 RepID=A0A4C1XFC8_EUMVA|nr:hypothetical protein EVAR_97972_1 [Eumeta japonica]
MTFAARPDEGCADGDIASYESTPLAPITAGVGKTRDRDRPNDCTVAVALGSVVDGTRGLSINYRVVPLRTAADINKSCAGAHAAQASRSDFTVAQW